VLGVENPATPWLATTLFVPARVPPTGFTPMAIVTAPLKLVTVLPLASCAVTCTAGLMTEPAPVLDGWIVNASWVTAIATRKSGLRSEERRVGKEGRVRWVDERAE